VVDSALDVLERIDGVRHAEAQLPDNRDGAARIAGQPERLP
jgi:hypothetical protein